MSSADIQIAVGSVSALVAAVALVLNYRSLRAKVFVDILSRAEKINFSRGMDEIRNLRCTDFAEFEKLNGNVKCQIRAVIDFLE